MKHCCINSVFVNALNNKLIYGLIDSICEIIFFGKYTFVEINGYSNKKKYGLIKTVYFIILGPNTGLNFIYSIRLYLVRLYLLHLLLISDEISGVTNSNFCLMFCYVFGVI